LTVAPLLAGESESLLWTFRDSWLAVLLRGPTYFVLGMPGMLFVILLSAFFLTFFTVFARVSPISPDHSPRFPKVTHA